MRLNIGYLLPGFSADADDDAIPVQDALVVRLSNTCDMRVLTLRYPHRRGTYRLHGATVHPLGYGQVRGAERLRLWADALLTLQQLHREQPFDVLHATWGDETGALAVWGGRMLGVPSVVTLAGGELVGLPNIGYGLQRGAFSRWTVGQALCADAVILPNLHMRRLLEKTTYRVDATQLRMIPMGVDVTGFVPANTPAPPDHLIHVGSLIPVKDQATLLRAFARVLIERPTAHLTIVGEGSERYRLEHVADDLSIGTRVTFARKVHHREIAAYYRGAAVHVLSSQHDAQPLAVFEAAACGLPTVSTAVGTVTDDPALGVHVPSGDAAALGAAILNLINDPTRLCAMGAAARARVMSAYTVEHTAAALISLYRELVERVQPRG